MKLQRKEIYEELAEAFPLRSGFLTIKKQNSLIWMSGDMSRGILSCLCTLFTDASPPPHSIVPSQPNPSQMPTIVEVSTLRSYHSHAGYAGRVEVNASRGLHFNTNF